MAQATFEKKPAIDYVSLYNQGYSIAELAKSFGLTYTPVRNMLIESGVKLRTKRAAAQTMLIRHPEWKNQFLKYKLRPESRPLSKSKIKLLFFVFTERCVHKGKIQFTNNEPILRSQFSLLVEKVYGIATKTTSGNVSYICSNEIAKDLTAYDIKTSIPTEIMFELLKSPELTKEVLRIFADTEGSVIISVRKAPRNYTVADRRVVLACTNDKVKVQLVQLLSSIGIKGHVGKVGVLIMDEASLREFDKQVGFSPGVKVIRKKAGHGVWYQYEKTALLKLLVRIYDEQKIKGNRGTHLGVFQNCKSKEEVLETLIFWYKEGGIRLGTSDI